jgi:hypothetical protein
VISGKTTVFPGEKKALKQKASTSSEPFPEKTCSGRTFQ